MLLVWLRSVLMETNSWAAISGPLESLLATGQPRHHVADGPRQAIEDGRRQQEGAVVRGLGVEHLLHQVVEDEPMRSAEGADECVQALSARAPVRQGCGTGQLQARSPAFGLGHQRLDLIAGQRELEDRPEEVVRLGRVEAKLGAPHFHQLTSRPEPGHGKRRLDAARGGHDHMRREVIEHEVQDAGGASGPVQVVQRQHGQPVSVVEVLDERHHAVLRIGTTAGDEGTRLPAQAPVGRVLTASARSDTN